MEQASGRRHQEGGIKGEAAGRSHQEEASGRRHLEGASLERQPRGGIMEEASWRRRRGGGIMEEAYWRHLGNIWERHQGGIKEEASWMHPFGKHLGGIREASGRHLGNIHLRFSPLACIADVLGNICDACWKRKGLLTITIRIPSDCKCIFWFLFVFSWRRLRSSLQITRMRTLEESGNIWKHRGSTWGHVGSVWDKT